MAFVSRINWSTTICITCPILHKMECCKFVCNEFELVLVLIDIIQFVLFRLYYFNNLNNMIPHSVRLVDPFEFLVTGLRGLFPSWRAFAIVVLVSIGLLPSGQLILLCLWEFHKIFVLVVSERNASCTKPWFLGVATKARWGESFSTQDPSLESQFSFLSKFASTGQITARCTKVFSKLILLSCSSWHTAASTAKTVGLTEEINSIKCITQDHSLEHQP